MNDKNDTMTKIYLATPYSGMEESAYSQVTYMAGLLTVAGYDVFSPITLSHAMILEGIKLPTDHEYWLQRDHRALEECDEIWVLIPDEGQEKVKHSKGCIAELQCAFENGIPHKYVKLGETDNSFTTIGYDGIQTQTVDLQ